MEARPKGASVCWKFWQVSLYLVAFACAVVAAVALGVAVGKFDGRCPLYTEGGESFFVFGDANLTIGGADDASIWEGVGTCDFCTFVPVVGATFGFVLAYFVIMFDTAHDGQGVAAVRGQSERLQKNRMRGLFLPLLFSSVLLTIFMLTSSVRTLKGTNVFCDGIQNALDLSCQEAQNLAWKSFPAAGNFYTWLLSSVITTWISTATFMLSIVLLLLRCVFYVDDDPSQPKKAKRTVKKKNAEPHKLPRTESQQSLLAPTESTIVPPMEPLPGTSTDEPQFTPSPRSSEQYPLTVIT